MSIAIGGFNLKAIKTVSFMVAMFATTRRCLSPLPNLLSTIGRTPVVRINALAPASVNLFAKCEFSNPLGSVKDRLALALVEEGERNGALKKGSTVVEGTSGNTGIALAFICAQRGYRFVAVMSETFSLERRKIMRGLGAKVVLTPAAAAGFGMAAKTAELAATHGWFATRQFENEVNADCHARTTGPEILSDFSSLPLDYWVTGWGTGGTFAGAGRVIKAARPETNIVLCEPDLAPLVASGMAQERNPDRSAAATHSAFKPHAIQGWAPNFIPAVLDTGLKAGLADRFETVTNEEAMETARLFAEKEGIFTGISGGAAGAVALRIAAEVPAGSNILIMLPDTQERYLSSVMYESIRDEMSEEEIQLSKSSPSFQL